MSRCISHWNMGIFQPAMLVYQKIFRDKKRGNGEEFVEIQKTLKVQNLEIWCTETFIKEVVKCIIIFRGHCFSNTDNIICNTCNGVSLWHHDRLHVLSALPGPYCLLMSLPSSPGNKRPFMDTDTPLGCLTVTFGVLRIRRNRNSGFNMVIWKPSWLAPKRILQRHQPSFGAPSLTCKGMGVGRPCHIENI